MKASLKTAFIMLICLAIPALAQAGEDALYAAEAPDGAAFIRVVNASVSGSLPEVRIGDKSIRDVQPVTASSYIYLPEGTYKITVGKKTEPLAMEKDQFYTAVVLSSGELKILKDKAFQNPRKALISFYNLTDSNGISLKTSDGKVSVIDPVEALSEASREINAVKVTLGAFSDGETVAQAAPVSLQRGKVFSFFVIDTGGSPRLIVAENRVDTSV
jgi:alginate O-acetyltransferase complex protein AlgF